MIKIFIAFLAICALDILFLWILVKTAGPDPDEKREPPGEQPVNDRAPIMDEYFGDLMK